MKRYRAVVAGLGAIGLDYDYDDPSRVQTHCRAFAVHHGFELVGGADPSANARRRLETRYKVTAFETLPELVAASRPEVIAIAASTAHHRALLEQALQARPRAILCEKPLAPTGAEGKAMVDAARDADVLLAVNYIRRFDLGVAELREGIARGEYGDIYKGVVWYAKGLLNNGSHYLDLLAYLLGEVRTPQVIERGRSLDNGDFEPDFRVRIGSADVYFIAGRYENYSHGGIELMGTRGRLEYQSGGRVVRTWRAAPDPTFTGYTALQEFPNDAALDVMRYQLHVVEALHAALEQGTPPASTGDSALLALETIDAIRTKVMNEQ